MSLLTPWGYTLTGVDSLPDAITVEEFNARTANKYTGDTRTAGAIASASQAIRDNVGWHLLPAAACKLHTSFLDKRIAFVGGDIIQIQLPARYVSAVTSVEIDGKEYQSFFVESNGLLKVYRVRCAHITSYSVLDVTYTAGLPDGLTNALKDIVANRALKSLAQSYGIQSETAGGLSVSYSAAWASDASSSSLSPAEEATLSPYRLRGVF